MVLGIVSGAAESKRKAFFMSLFFSLGLMVSYTLLGIAFGLASNFAVKLVTWSKYIFFASGILLFLLGVIISGLIKTKYMQKCRSINNRFQRFGLAGIFLFGILFALVEIPGCPCCGSVLLIIASIIAVKGSGIYGFLNLTKESYKEDVDYYMGICPDMDFNEYLIQHLIEAAIQIPNKYFMITPQIYKCWDASWDVLVNEKFKDIPYEQCLSRNSNEIVKLTNDVSVEPIDDFKFAGWIDIFNKAFYEKLAPVLDSWNGYGPLDLYAMNIARIAKSLGEDVQQYIIKNQIVWFYDAGSFKHAIDYGGDGKLKTVYDKYIVKKLGRQLQREPIDTNMQQLLVDWLKYYKKELKDK